MANVVTFTVNDTSPTILYSPFGGTFSTPNLSASWNPYYTLSGYASAPGDVGIGTSLHITSDNGSSLVVQWHGTGVQLYGNATSASYSITLDGAPFTPAATSDNNVLVTIRDLADVPHAVTLTALIPAEQNPPNSSLVVFESAVLTSSPEPVYVSSSSQTIDDNDIAFLGRWSYDTAPTGASFHSSQTLGDRAVTSFNGTTFLLHGVTSPNAGNFTVTVDNVTTTLSAQSSFTVYDSLLFYATGLDSTSTHYVQVSNSGGSNLSLLVGGFNTFAPFSTLSSPPLQTSQTSVVARGFSQGTIAAFVLAGILAFLFFSSVIFYFFFYRPRRRRRRVVAERKKRSPKENEAGVIDIVPEVNITAEIGSRIEPDQHGSPGELSLPTRFRSSGSLDEKFANPLNEVPFDDLSDLSSNSSARRKAKTKNKGKARKITGRSWSPLDIPIHRSRAQHLSTNTAESLGCVSTFIAAEPPSSKNVAPPSYAVSIRDSKSTTNGNPIINSPSNRSMPSVPHSVSAFPDDQERSYPPQKQDHTGAFLLPQGELNSELGSSVHSSPSRLKMPQPPMKSSTRGSEVEDNGDVTLPASLQHAIRSLSPRPARHPYASQDEDSIQTHSPQNINFLEDAVLTLMPETPSNNDDLVEVRDGVFLSISPPSPFQLTFDAKPPTSDKSNSGELSYLSTPSDSKPTAGNLIETSELPNPDDDTGPIQTSPEFLEGSSNMRFRLTHLSIPPPNSAHPSKSSSNGDSEGVMSFLDFSSSREGSLTSRSEEKQRGILYPPVEEISRWSNTTVPSLKSKSSLFGNRQQGILYPPVEEKSRWSYTTVPSLKSKSSDVGNSSGSGYSSSNRISDPRSVQSSTFPIPIRVSIPSSYDNAIVSAPRSRTSGLTQTGDTLHVHPPLEGLESPTESMSIPMSAVSELLFRQSVSEENTGFNSRRTTQSSLVFVSSHPPLPTRHDEIMTRPFDPSILVNRVLGISPPAMSVRTAAAYPSPPISSLSPFASSHASRLITDTLGDPSNSQNSRTDSLDL